MYKQVLLLVGFFVAAKWVFGVCYRTDIIVVKPGDLIERGPFRITVLRGKHIRFDLRLIMQTLFNQRVILHRSNLKLMLRENRRYPAGEVLVYFIEYEGQLFRQCFFLPE